MMVFTRNHLSFTGEAMLIKTLLNKVERFKSFIYGDAVFQQVREEKSSGY